MCIKDECSKSSIVHSTEYAHMDVWESKSNLEHIADVCVCVHVDGALVGFELSIKRTSAHTIGNPFKQQLSSVGHTIRKVKDVRIEMVRCQPRAKCYTLFIRVVVKVFAHRLKHNYIYCFKHVCI